MKKKLVILDGHCLNPGDLSWDGLRALSEVEVHERTAPGDVVTRLRGAALAMTNKTPVPAAALQQLPGLAYIGVMATGYDVVDAKAARARGITVTNVPTYGTASVAQHTFALLLELCHHVGRHSEAVRDGEWAGSKDWSFWKTPLIELAGKTLGVVGFGRIGRAVGRIADAMGMRVIARDVAQHDPPPYPGFRWVEIDELLRESDVVTLHCPLTPEDRGLIDRARLRLMKRTAFLLNVSRGPLVVDEDLAAALNEGTLAGAGLDVLSAEPPAAGNPLFTARNCIVTPHLAWATQEARGRLLQIAVDNVAAFLRGEPQNVVN